MAIALALGPVLGFLIVAVLARPSAEATAAPAAVRRTVLRWRWAGLLLGLLVAAVAWDRDPLGRGVLLAAPLLALCVLAGVVVGETRAVRPAGITRRAALETRQVRDYLPRVPGWTVAAAGTTLTALLAATTTAASADDLGRAGRSLAYDCGRFAGCTALGPARSTACRWPSWSASERCSPHWRCTGWSAGPARRTPPVTSYPTTPSGGAPQRPSPAPPACWSPSR
ncbi:hypothetical protein MRQ36_18485 [Micromonospora sp. R77]|uniref:hypothetical protein n=1 Tax=Micromonospora sp. R77 TaxID=2925836 RepID=UPI001F625343|nr:hypothetical protein [Micromonospora sp. R77]MCI4064479.1 hypothetical protein [Micromonospora sp. R77]